MDLSPDMMVFWVSSTLRADWNAGQIVKMLFRAVSYHRYSYLLAKTFCAHWNSIKGGFLNMHALCMIYSDIVKCFRSVLRISARMNGSFKLMYSPSANRSPMSVQTDSRIYKQHVERCIPHIPSCLSPFPRLLRYEFRWSDALYLATITFYVI